jgi:flagellar biosynthesis/type III secretory pathway protein FliH
MTFLALHRGSDVALSTTRWLLTEDEATACHSAVELLARLQTLHDERRKLLESACASAHAQGYAAGRQEAIGLLAPQWLQAWRQAAAASAAQSVALKQAAGMLACQIVHQIASELAPADVVAALVRGAIAARVPVGGCVVHVHPAVAVALAAVQTRSAPEDAAAELSVQADARLGLLDCVIQNPLGDCVVGLQSQLEQLARGMSE